MTVKVDVLRGEQLISNLTRFPAKVEAQIKAAMAEQADEIVAMMKRLVPVEPGKPDLKDSIGWRWGGRAPKGSESVGTMKNGGIVLTIYAANRETFYGTFVEFGTSKMAAQPFFFPAWRAGKKEARRKMRAAVRAAARQFIAS